MAHGRWRTTGTVAFYDRATELGTGTLSGGVATFTTSALDVATHSITAQYGGDANFAASTSSALSQTVAAPAPADLTATAASGGGVTLAWTAPAASVTGYNVYCGTASGQELSLPLNTTLLAADATSFTDATALAGNTYYYIVQAVNGSLTGASSEASLTLAAGGSQTQVDLSGACNRQGLTTDGVTYSGSGGLDGAGDSLSATLLGGSQSWSGEPFALGDPRADNVIAPGARPCRSWPVNTPRWRSWPLPPAAHSSTRRLPCITPTAPRSSSRRT